MIDRIRLPFQEQIEFFRKKLNLPTESWDDIWQQAHDRAFVVAGAMNADLLDDLRKAVDAAISGGDTIQDFRKKFKTIVEKHGWHGWTGEGSKAGEAWRTRTIYTTNIATSYAAGRWQQLNDPDLLKLRPYWRYVHNDSVMSPRPQHKAWGDSGLTLRHDHPFWKTHFPPNGWGCHCRVTAVKGPGENDATEPPEGWNIPDAKGNLPGIDKGWAYAPGASVSEELRKFADAKAAKLPPELARDFSASVAGMGKAWDNGGMKDLQIRRELQSESFRRFFDGEHGTPGRFQVADLNEDERALFGVKSSEMWLSRISLDEHKEKHAEVGIEDYRRIPDIVRNAQVWQGPDGKRFALLLIDGKPYRAAIKIDADGNEAWFLSLIFNTKQKPPKGAVRVR